MKKILAFFAIIFLFSFNSVSLTTANFSYFQNNIDCNSTIDLQLKSKRLAYNKSFNLSSDKIWFSSHDYRSFLRSLEIPFMSKEQKILVDALEERLITLGFLYRGFLQKQQPKAQENYERFQKAIINYQNAEQDFYKKWNKYCSLISKHKK